MNPKIILGLALAVFTAFPSLPAQESLPAAPVAPAPENAESNIAARITAVIVFPNGARITRSAEVKLNAGEQEIVLAGFPKDITPESIVAETTIPGIKITAVSSELSYADKGYSHEAAQKLTMQIEDLGKKITALNQQIRELGNYSSSLKFASQRNDNAQSTINIEAAMDDADFIFNELLRIGVKTRQLQKELQRATLEQQIALSEHRKLQSYNQTATRSVKLKVVSDNPANGIINISYMANQASWRPSYDVLVDAESKQARLVAYGVVAQQTGEDWDNVPVTLSTAQPSVSADLPEFKKVLISERYQAPKMKSSPAFLGEFDSSYESSGSGGGHGAAVAEGVGFGYRAQPKTSNRLVISNAKGNVVALSDGRSVENAQNIRFQDGNYVFENAGILEKVSAKNVIGIRQIAVESGTTRNPVQASRLRDPSQYLRGLDFRYDLARAENIPSTGTQHRYLLSTETFAGDFYYQLVPAVNDNAYQMLSVENKRFRPILAGPANIFYGADFIGEMELPYTQRDGKIAIPLGVDPRISVERQKTNNIDTVGTFTHSRRNRVSTEITIRNRTPEAVRIVCEEAIPQSTTDRIEVSEPDFSPKANFDKETGIASWNESLKPSETLKLDIRYTLDYPLNFILEEHSR